MELQDDWTPQLDDYVDLSAFLLGSDAEVVRSLPRISLGESAIHAPFAAFGGVLAYPELIDQAAVLMLHLAKNHPLPDGNKRAAFLLTARFLDANGYIWGSPDVETDAGMVERVAAGDAAHEGVATWIRARTSPKRHVPPAPPTFQRRQPKSTSRVPAVHRERPRNS